MNHNTISAFLVLAIGIFLSSCCNKVTSTPEAVRHTPTEPSDLKMAGPPVIIYKTKKDCNHQVPVILSPDKKTVVSYPGTGDLYFQGSFAYPTILEKGYLLDNRGITENAAFLNLSYEQYSKLQSTPKPDELLKMILDADPITEMYYCGTKYQYQDLAEELNKAIRDGKLGEFKKLK